VGLLSLRVLIVDDSETTRRVLRSIIHSQYWLVCGEAENGWSGVRKFEELKPDVVVLDLSMPDISGIEAAKWMTESDPTVPLILFTVLETEGNRERGKTSGHSRNRAQIRGLEAPYEYRDGGQGELELAAPSP